MNNNNYGVLPIPTHLGNIIDRDNNHLKPFVAIYFPVEIFTKMGWIKETNLIMSVEKGFLKIRQSGDDIADNYYKLPRELIYEAIDED